MDGQAQGWQGGMKMKTSNENLGWMKPFGVENGVAWVVRISFGGGQRSSCKLTGHHGIALVCCQVPANGGTG